MKTMFSLRRHDYLKRLGMWLMVVTLIAGILSCAGDGVGPYNLTMAADPEEGGTATDETNESPYEEGAIISIQAVAAEGYEFDGWTALAGEFADASAAETTFTMPAQDVRVSAQFKRKALDHFRVYGLDPATNPSLWPYVGEPVELEDQFVSITATVGLATAFANPVAKSISGEPRGSISNPDHHLMGFTLEGVEPQWFRVTVSNQFGTQELTVAGPMGLSVPTQKLYPKHESMSGDAPEGLDYFLGYEVIDPSPIEVRVNLGDQFGNEEDVLVTQAKVFANPVTISQKGVKISTAVNPDAHGVSYWILADGAATKQHGVLVSNQFGEYEFKVWQGEEGVLSVPSVKKEWEPIEPPLDHFRCYNAADYSFPYVGEVVELRDQFGTFTATVGLGTTFCNPVEKAVNEIAAWEWVPISHPDYHLMLWMLDSVEPSGEWVVEVNNQFGTQKWRVAGPAGLAVPTQKIPHGEPLGLDYFLLYGVTESPRMDVVVDLSDQFGGGDNNFEMVDPYAYIFGNPVQITHDGKVTDIVNPGNHLVFYWMRDEDAPPGLVHHPLDLLNLFGKVELDVIQGNEAFLAVPSEKINWYAD